MSGSQQELAVSVSKKDGKMSDPTFSMPENPGQVQAKRSITQHLQDEALKKLQSLQEQLVGGEKRNDQSLKEKRKARKQHAMSKREKMMQAAQSMEGDTIMVKVYDNLQDEIKAKNKQLQKLENEVKAANTEIEDIQSEFERDRQDYLDTIRKLEQQVKLQQQILDKVQPCIRRDCNYFNLDKVKLQSKWNDENQNWDIPDLVLEKTVLPTGLAPGPRSTQMSQRQPLIHQNGGVPAGDIPSEYFEEPKEDKFLRHLSERSKEDAAGSYFKSKRAEKLLSASSNMPQDNWQGRDGRQHKFLTSVDSPRDTSVSSETLRSVSPGGGDRLSRPLRLESLPQSAFEKKKKKPKKDGLKR